MKKLFIVFAVATLGFVACNNDSETTTTTDSIAPVGVDSMPPATDSMPPAVDTAKAPMDTLKKN